MRPGAEPGLGISYWSLMPWILVMCVISVFDGPSALGVKIFSFSTAV